MKRILGTIMTVILLLLNLPVNISAEISGDFKYYISDGNAIIVIYTGTAENLVFPNTINGYPVTKIYQDSPDPLFVNALGITSITIPDNVTYIHPDDFGICENLTSIIVDSNNKTYSSDNNGILYNKDKTELLRCPSKQTGSVEIPDSVKSIGSFAFFGCDNLSNIIIPRGVTSIGEYAFCGCDNLSSLTIPYGVTSIDEYAFSYCNSLTTIALPDSVIEIGESAFSDCDNLISIIIPKDISSIAGGTFSDCDSLTSIVIPDSVIKIDDGAFYKCNTLKTINIPGSVSDIDFSMFSSCPELISIVVAPNNMNYSSDGQGVVYNKEKTKLILCPPAKSDVEIPTGVTSIGNHAFAYCNNLTAVDIPVGITSIDADAFSDCNGLTTINISDSVVDIGSGAFAGCSRLTTINIPNSVTSIGVGTFEDCTSLKAIDIPVGVTTIGGGAFSSCTNLKTVTINNPHIKIEIDRLHRGKATYYDSHPFRGCEAVALYGYSGSTAESFAKEWKIGFIPIDIAKASEDYLYIVENGRAIIKRYKGENENIIIPGGLDKYSVAGIADYAFAGYKNLKSVTIMYGAEYIGDYAFRNCSNLTSITIPDSVTYIGAGSFYYCTELTEIDIPNNVTGIGHSAFFCCYKLTAVTIPNGISYLGDDLLAGCWNLKSVMIPDSVTYIGSDAFRYCYNLESLTIPESVTFVHPDICSDFTVATIYGFSGSVAETYAKFKWRNFIPIVKLTLNGRQLFFDIPPHIRNNRTFVPLRAIFEAMGAAVEWDDTTKTVTAIRENTIITMQIGNDIFTKNGQPLTLDVPAQIVGGRTLVPVRAVSESFGAEVQWDEVARTVIINY